MQISWGRRKNEWGNPIWLELNQLAALNQQGGLWTIENKKIQYASDWYFRVAPCKGIQIPTSGKFLLVDSQILDLSFGMRNTNQGIRNLAIDWNPES